MASASDRRYQSRLFNFIHQQIRRVSEQSNQAFRHLKVSTSLGIQVLLYPIYLLFQSTRLAGKQLHSPVQQNWPQLATDDPHSQPQTPPTADAPIQQVLLLVDALPLEEEGGRSQRRAGVSPVEATGVGRWGDGEMGLSVGDHNLLPTNPLFPNGFKPLNLFMEKWNWVASLFKPLALDKRYSLPISPQPQRGPLAPSPPLPLSFLTPAESPTHNRPVVQGIATQLSNRTLVIVTAQNKILDILTPQQQQKLQEQITREVAKYWHHRILQKDKGIRGNSFSDQALAFLDRTVAELESNRLAPVSEVAIALVQRSWGLVLAVQNRLSVSLSGKAQLDNIRQPAIAPAPAETPKFRIQALIWAAIDYFFGNRGEKHLFSDDLDPWLTSSDLFGTPESEGVLMAHSQLQSQLVERQKHNRTVDRARKKPRSLKTSESLQPSSQDTQLEPAPEWIETHAAAMGYVKHPLEQLLEWLDRAMLWLEEVLMSAGQWVRSLL